MITLKKILVPTDFSRFSQISLDYARELADKFQAELHLLHILVEMLPLGVESGLTMPPPGLYIEELRKSAEQSLKSQVPPEWLEKHKVVLNVAQGVPFLEVIRYAKEHEIDLIVMGTHGHTGLAHVLLGSVAERVVRKAPCPVLTVRAPDHKFEMP